MSGLESVTESVWLDGCRLMTADVRDDRDVGGGEVKRGRTDVER